MSLRPEKIEIGRQGQGRFAGSIKNSFFLGNLWMYEVQTTFGLLIVSVINNHQQVYKIGENVSLDWHENALKVNSEVYLESIRQANQCIDSTLFRPPYGKITPGLIRKIRKEYRIILWSWLSYDYDSKISIQKILQKARSIQSGDILVLHDNDKIVERQKELLPALIELLNVKNLKSKTLDSAFSPNVD